MDPLTTIAFAFFGAGALQRSTKPDIFSQDGKVVRSTIQYDPTRVEYQRPTNAYGRRSAAISQLWGMRHIRNGWDGGEAIAPSAEALAAAEDFLNLLPYNTTTPRVGLAADGELGLFWNEAGHYIDIGFDADGSFGYYASSPDGEDVAEAVSLGERLPRSLERLLPEESEAAEAA